MPNSEYRANPGYYIFSGLLSLFGGAIIALIGIAIQGFFWKSLFLCSGIGLIGYATFLIVDCKAIARL